MTQQIFSKKMWLNKSITKINAMLKILDIMSLIYIYIFGFRIGTLNLNMSFPCIQVYKNGLKWTKMNRSGLNGPN